MVCLDSDVIINFLRNEKNSVDIINQLKEKGHRLLTTSINVFELWKGAIRSNKKDAKNAVEEFLSNIEVLEFDDNSSKTAAEIFESLRKKGEMIDELDVFIGAIAINNEEEIFTLNKKHFEKIEGLNLIDFTD